MYFKWVIPSLFFIYFRSFLTNANIIFTANQCEQMLIEYTVLRFEPLTVRLRAPSHNHETRAPALTVICLVGKWDLKSRARQT